MSALEEYADRHEMHFAGPAAKTPWIRRIESKYADAAIESLKVCGNCGHHATWYGLRYCDERPHGAIGFSVNETDEADHCTKHFTPSRWQERER